MYRPQISIGNRIKGGKRPIPYGHNTPFLNSCSAHPVSTVFPQQSSIRENFTQNPSIFNSVGGDTSINAEVLFYRKIIIFLLLFILIQCLLLFLM